MGSIRPFKCGSLPHALLEAGEVIAQADAVGRGRAVIVRDEAGAVIAGEVGVPGPSKITGFVTVEPRH